MHTGGSSLFATVLVVIVASVPGSPPLLVPWNLNESVVPTGSPTFAV